MPQTPQSQDPAHDVLAAEAFAMPAPDPILHHHGPVVLPDDPTGIEEPHDVLAAEEFPMPAPRLALDGPARKKPGRVGIAVGAGLLLLVLIRRLRAASRS